MGSWNIDSADLETVMLRVAPCHRLKCSYSNGILTSPDDLDGPVQSAVDKLASGTSSPLAIAPISLIALASYRMATAQDVNQTIMTIAWDDIIRRREDDPISIDSANQNITVRDKPDQVEIFCNIPIAIASSANIQRPAQVMEIIRSDGEIISAAATGYIRDSSGHEEASYHLAVIDPDPIQDGAYHVSLRRETTRAGVVNTDPLRSLLSVRVYI